jgi:voltage-gated potassium channel Kch
MADSALHLLGVDLSATYASAGELPHQQGTEVATQDGKAVLAFAASTVVQGSVVVLAPSSGSAEASCVALLLSAGNDRDGRLAIAQRSVASAAYGWFHTEKNKNGRVLASAGTGPASVRIYVNDTGIVDDATASAAIDGLFIQSTASAAAEAVGATWANLHISEAI